MRLFARSDESICTSNLETLQPGDLFTYLAKGPEPHFSFCFGPKTGLSGRQTKDPH